MRDRPPHRELRPLLFSNSVWVLLRPTELIMKNCETGPTVYRPYPYSSKIYQWDRNQTETESNDKRYGLSFVTFYSITVGFCQETMSIVSWFGFVYTVRHEVVD